MSSTELRLFISSTFQDLQEERAHLVKKVFPEVAALCRERGITFTEVDLRWGVTEEEVMNGQVVRTCLEEIDCCRPYFIGITGRRYGYVPDLAEVYKDPVLLRDYPWIEEAAADGASILDYEFRHAALNDPASAKAARFFFLRERRSIEHVDVSGPERDRLEDLKQRVRDAGLHVEEFRDPASLGDMVFDELVEIIERDFGDVKPPTPLEQERARHAGFAASRTRAYIPNAENLKRLNAWLASEEPPLVVYAESGAGKSSLVAFWCEQLRRRNPDLFILEHYVGIGARDSDHLGIIAHVLEEIKQRYNLTEEIPSGPAELEQAFANWLGFGVGSPFLLVLDGMNQLSGRALELDWIPPVMPPGVRLVITTTIEQTLLKLQSRGWEELAIQPLNEREREALVVRFLAEYHKSLSAEQVRLVADDPKCAHPLFLRTLLEELRVNAVHERLTRILSQYLATSGTEDLFQRVLERLEDDFGTRTVREVMSLLWCSRRGLNEEDLAALTGVSRLKLSTVLLGLDYHLVRRDGVLSFFHDYLRRAVEERYLVDDGLKRVAWRELAAYFESAPVTLRATLELVHALESLGDRERLQAALSQIDRFMSMWRAEQHELQRLWSWAEPAEIAGAYQCALQTWRERDRAVEEQSEVMGQVVGVLEFSGAWSEAEQIERERLELLGASGDRAGESRALTSLSDLARKLGRYDEAAELALKAESIARSHGDLQCIADAVNHCGLVHSHCGRFDEALACFHEEEQIARSLGNRWSISVAAGNRGVVYYYRREYDRALASFLEQEQLARERGDRRCIAHALGNRGIVYADSGNHDEALACYRQQEQIARELGDRGNLAMATGNRGNLHADRGEYDEALACFREHEQVVRELGDRVGIASVVGNRGTVYAARGEYGEALACYLEAAEEHRATGYRLGLAEWLSETAQVLLALVESCGTPPEVLAEAIPGATQETWRTRSLHVARERAMESVAISNELATSDTLFSASLVLARIDAIEGNADAAHAALTSMLATVTDDAQRAELHYWLWKLGDPAHFEPASQLYRALAEGSQKRHIRDRAEELVAVTAGSSTASPR